MTRAWLIWILATAGLLCPAVALPQQAPVATFKSSVDLVRVAAIVRDRKGRFVDDLTERDFEVLEGSQPRTILDFQREQQGVSVALLFDVSGSMESRLADAREAANHVLAWLDESRDEAAIFTFDTSLVEVVSFTQGLKTLPPALALMKPFGATSLHDAIARAAEHVARREGRRHAVAVLTDGRDNASRMKPADVSAIASAIDVPVYIFGVVASIDHPGEDAATESAGSWLAGSLDDLATHTGGRVILASTPAQRSLAARQIVDELRHQYLIAFESSGKPGWHPLVVRARNKDLVVHARNGYIAGQSRPTSF